MKAPDRTLSEWIWNNPHIDDMTMAQMLPLVRGKAVVIFIGLCIKERYDERREDKSSR